MKRPYLFNIFFTITLFFFCCSEAISQTKEVQSNSELFPTKGHKEITILAKKRISADTLKKRLLIVPNHFSWVQIGRELNYFKEVMTMAELEKEIIARGLTNKIPSMSGRIGLYNAYIHYKPFVILIMSNEDLKTKGFRTRLSLYDPFQSEIIFKNEVRLNLMWEGYSIEKVLNPLLNSLANYLNEQN